MPFPALCVHISSFPALAHPRRDGSRYDMPSPVDLALTSLLPYISFPPEELQRLTTSLLTQSRARAPRLKADEEVARTFACAHIACERLQNRLELEIGKDVRPPCPPRVYARLKAFLIGVLGSSQQQQQQQQEGRQQKSLEHGQSEAPRSTPGSARTPTETSTSTPATTPRAGRKRGIESVEEGEQEDNEGIPKFASRLLKHLCAVCKVSVTVVDRTRAGAADVVREIASRRKSDVDAASMSKRRRGRANPRGAAQSDPSSAQPTPTVPMSRWPALLVALLLCTVAKVKGLEMDEPKMKGVRKQAVEAASSFSIESESEITGQLTQKPGDLDKMVAFYLLEAGDCGWLEMQWYEELPSMRDDEGEDDVDEKDDEIPFKPWRPAKTPLRRKEKHGSREDAGDDFGPAGLLPGLGTMFQPSIDWLGDDRRVQFAQWKQDVLERIATIEQQA